MRLAFAFFVAILLTIIPLPLFLSDIRPAWILLLILYVEFFKPQYFKIHTILITGLIIDALLVTVLGEHSFAYLVVTLLALDKSRRFHFYSSSQQISLIGAYCFMYEMIISIVDYVLGYGFSIYQVMLITIASLFIWPLMKLVLDEYLGFEIHLVKISSHKTS